MEIFHAAIKGEAYTCFQKKIMVAYDVHWMMPSGEPLKWEMPAESTLDMATIWLL